MPQTRASSLPSPLRPVHASSNRLPNPTFFLKLFSLSRRVASASFSRYSLDFFHILLLFFSFSLFFHLYDLSLIFFFYFFRPASIFFIFYFFWPSYFIRRDFIYFALALFRRPFRLDFSP